jgi:NAD(P)-dependent dehydrogenase (short-subunit alcohol dehydrogenase family)
MNILITGAARGLGLALTELCLEQGHRVFALSRSISPGIESLLEAYPNQKLWFIPTDVSQESQVRVAVTKVTEQTDRIDLLINNAAVHLEQTRPDLPDLDFSTYPETFRINSIAPLLVVQYCLPLLEKGSGKSIVTISSEAGSIEDCWRDREYSYCMSKAAINMGMKILHNRLKGEGFRIRLIHPGWVQTDMGGQQADLTPRESAQGVFNQIMRKKTEAEPLYINWKGEPLPW